MIEIVPTPNREPPRYSTVLCGIRTFNLEGFEDFTFLVRVAREEHSGRYFVFGDKESFATLDAAKQKAESGEWHLEWWPSCAGENGDPVCFLCGSYNRQLEAPERHPKRLCSVCELEAVDATGRPLRFENESMGGGFRALYADTGEPYPSHVCYVRGVECHADEARFGGIVVEVR
jgi:hypothetical protein